MDCGARGILSRHGGIEFETTYNEGIDIIFLNMIEEDGLDDQDDEEDEDNGTIAHALGRRWP